MSKWEKVRLGDVAEIIMGQSPESSSYNDVGKGIPFYQGNADFGDLHPVVRVYCSNPKKIALSGDVLLSVRAPIGAINLARETCCIGRGLAALRVNKYLLNSKFLYYLLKVKNAELNLKGTGSTFKAINKNRLNELQFKLPPIQLQLQITEKLDLTVVIIKKQKQQLVELDNLIKSIFYDMFGDPVVNEKGWEKFYLPEVMEIIDGDRGVNYPKQEDFLDRGHCLFLNTGNVTKNGFSFSNVKFISETKDNQLRKGKLVRDDVVMTTRGTVGNIAYYDERVPFDNVRINSGMVILRRKSNLLSQVFFCHLMRIDDMVREILSFKSGTAQPQLPIRNMKKIKIPLPPLSLQNEFANIVAKIEEQKAQVKKAIEQSQLLFDSLMSKYFDD